MTRRGFFQQHSVTASCICSNALFSICRMRSAEPLYFSASSAKVSFSALSFGKLCLLQPGFVGAGNQDPRITPAVGKHLGGSQCPYVVIIVCISIE